MYNHIGLLPARENHYCRNQSRHKQYLNLCLSVLKMYRNFVAENHDLLLKAKYGMYSKIFPFEFNTFFAFPRCLWRQLDADLKKAEPIKDREAEQQRKMEIELHRKADIFNVQTQNELVVLQYLVATPTPLLSQ